MVTSEKVGRLGADVPEMRVVQFETSMNLSLGDIAPGWGSALQIGNGRVVEIGNTTSNYFYTCPYLLVRTS